MWSSTIIPYVLPACRANIVSVYGAHITAMRVSRGLVQDGQGHWWRLLWLGGGTWVASLCLQQSRRHAHLACMRQAQSQQWF